MLKSSGRLTKYIVMDHSAEETVLLNFEGL